MKYIVLSLLLLFPIFVTFALPADCKIDSSVSAAEMLKKCGENSTGVSPADTATNTDTQQWVRDRIVSIATVVISFWALLAVWAIVWAGIQYTKAYGEDEQMKKAKTTGIFAVIWLFLLMAAFPLVDMFINFVYTVAWQP